MEVGVGPMSAGADHGGPDKEARSEVVEGKDRLRDVGLVEFLRMNSGEYMHAAWQQNVLTLHVSSLVNVLPNSMNTSIVVTQV